MSFLRTTFIRVLHSVARAAEGPIHPRGEVVSAVLWSVIWCHLITRRRRAQNGDEK